MGDTRSVAASCGYVLTTAGLRAIDFAERCQCRPERVGRSIICCECGTHYGTITGDSRPAYNGERKPD